MLFREKLLKDVEFIVEMDKLKAIKRKTKLIGENKQEDDAQHSWHISLMAMILSEYTNEKVDLLKVIKMLLIHDLVEIYAGDTFCYDVEGNANKKDRELAASEKLYALLDRQKADELRELWDEFEAMETKESKFANSMDRLQPMLLNLKNEGGTWKEYDVSKSEVYQRIVPVKDSSDELWCYVNFMIEDAFQKGFINKR